MLTSIRVESSPMSDSHPAIVNWSAIEKSEPFSYDGSDEPMAFNANYRRHFGFGKIGVHHERLSSGRRLSRPHAESAEEEFVYVIEGTPDVWLDGEIFRLKSGDAVGFPAGTGLAHTFINNSPAEVRLLVVGEASKPENRIIYPRNPESKAVRPDWWDDAPKRELGPHDGLPDALREARASSSNPRRSKNPNPQLLDEIYAFWFGDVGDATVLPESRVRYWMAGGEETDREIRERFGDRIAEAAKEQWPIEALTREQAVALVVLFDQFPRNCYRESGEAFAYDHLALGLAKQLEASGWHFTTAERFFLALPFTHHEDLSSQDHAVYLAALELERGPEAALPLTRLGLKQAVRHRDIIEQFGRFPHRNAMLGRESTPEEIAFMGTAINGRGF
ncbi:MAG: DUF924 family protein [Planctomycetaceae bacterium]|nr:DUF924 family protein [Planctomycetaceae bacterium]